VPQQHPPGVGQTPVAPGALEQRHAGLALEDRELLRHGRERVANGVSDGADGTADVELTQQPQSSKVEHRCRDTTWSLSVISTRTE
jgi:hypothetical protein